MESLTQEHVDALVDAVYEAALDPGRWQDFCQLLDRTLDGAYVGVHAHDMIVNRNLDAFYTRHEDAYFRSYKDYYDQKNILVGAIRSRAVGVPVRVEDLVSMPSYLRSEFYNDWLRPQEDIGSGGSVLLANTEGWAVIFGAHVRRVDADEKMPRLMDLLTLLAPHVHRAFSLYEMSRRMRGQNAVLQTLMEDSQSALIVIDEAGRPIEANARAQALFENNTLGVDLVGAVTVSDPVGGAFVTAALHAVRTAVAQLDEAVTITLGGAAGSGVMRAVPLSNATRRSFAPLLGNRSVPTLILSISSFEPFLIAARERYALSPAEAAVLRGLLEGKAIKRLAEERQTSINTVRNQVAALFSKTGAASQRELIGLFARQMRL